MDYPLITNKDYERLLESIDPKKRRGNLTRELARGFFLRSDEGYLECRKLETLLKQWEDLSAWVDVRKDGEVKARVFNPTLKDHGYSLDRTVLQTAMPDQPFIYDSLQLLLRRLGVAPLRCLHPTRA